MPTTYEQFVAYGTDLAGLERLLRLFQSACSLLISYPLMLAALVPSAQDTVLATKAAGLGAMRTQLNISRRFIRLFRFMDTLNAGFDSYTAPEKNLVVWLDVISKTSLGLFGMTETLTLVDLVGIDGVSIFGSERSKEIDYQSQFLWLFGLAASVLISLIKLSNINAQPADKPAKALTSEKDAKKEETKETKEKSPKDAEDEKKRQKEIAAQKKVLLRAIVSDTVDMLLPGSAVGWVPINGGQVSSAMFFTTLTTGWAVWDKIGAKLQK